MAKILLIDDEEQMRFVLTRMLKRDGHEVFVEQDGVEGVQSFYQVNPDLVITDIIMPKKDGIEVIIELIQAHPKLPIIAISGGRRAVTAGFNLDSAHMLGVRASLLKPFTHQQLLNVIEDIMQDVMQI
jgi:CheY-like chemotaxis protein